MIEADDPAAATCASNPEALVLHTRASSRPSFPSRHGLTIGCFVAAAFFASRLLGWGALLYGALAAYARVYAGKHWPTDVLAGIVLGALVVWPTWRVVPRILGFLGLGRLGRWIEPPPPRGGSGPMSAKEGGG